MLIPGGQGWKGLWSIGASGGIETFMTAASERVGAQYWPGRPRGHIDLQANSSTSGLQFWKTCFIRSRDEERRGILVYTLAQSVPMISTGLI